MTAVRAERKDDHERVFEIQSAAFERRNEAELVGILRRATAPHLSLVAEEGNRVLGHVFFSPLDFASSREPPRAAGLAPVAVDPAHQGRGIGASLVRAGLEGCSALGWQAVFLIGDPGYYARFGFVLALPLGFTCGSPRFDPVLQVLELEAGALAGRSGRIRFHPAFAETGCA